MKGDIALLWRMRKMAQGWILFEGILTFGDFTGTLGMASLSVLGCLPSRCRMLLVGMRFLMKQLFILVAR